MREREPITFSKRLLASTAVAAIAAIAALESPSLEIPPGAAAVVGFGGTMIATATVQAALTIGRTLRRKE